ncbi:MAG: glycogen debranching protein GlgX [Burkholderiaceae bacterium]|nr:glycogen debranching protein GlgX [Burkholderiaceae bacterium]
MNAQRRSTATKPAKSAAPSLLPGRVTTLGAQLQADGVHFALTAPHAQAVELCLFAADGQTEIARLPMPTLRDGIWQGVLPSAAGGVNGLIYGWRVHGPWAPHEGHRFNPAKLLLDPCAREVVGRYDGSDIHLGHDPAHPDRPDPRDNAATALKARVVADLPPLAQPRPAIDPAQRVIYELHVKGYTAQHPDVPPALRGSYAGLAHPASIAHLKALGITTVSLLPIAFRADEARLQHMGLSNYWGYTPIAWSAPETRLWSGTPGSTPRSEFRALVDALHAAGLEVILDVVYNHTAELDPLSGPTLSLRGIDNALYYHLDPQDPSRTLDWTGCGNSLNLNAPLVLRVVMDSLRRWVTEFGVDGFRFDLASTLARGTTRVNNDFQSDGAFLSAISQDPVLCNCLLVAEPWDLGPGGYRVGGFPPGWLEWNDRFRDTQRGFWLQHQNAPSEFATRLAGSSDVFHPALRGPHSSVNFITAHDGFTLRDLVSYAHRHNHANGEDNRDGHGHNLSTNNGVEGPTDHADVLAARARQSRALLAVLLLALGTPMLLAGDELGHSQRGNNNAYCQDNALSWIDWAQADVALRDFVRGVLALRRKLPLLQSHAWWAPAPTPSQPGAVWYRADGQPMERADWERDDHGALMVRLSTASQQVLILINAEGQEVPFTLGPGSWILRLSSDNGFVNLAQGSQNGDKTLQLGAQQTLPPTSLLIATQEGPARTRSGDPLA